jgi:hypothetical protein
MSGNYNGMNGDWRGSNRADVLFSDEEVWMLSQIDAADQPGAMWVGTIGEQEMRCQRDMRVRGKRLWNYHLRLGDLLDILGLRLVES